MPKRIQPRTDWRPAGLDEAKTAYKMTRLDMDQIMDSFGSRKSGACDKAAIRLRGVVRDRIRLYRVIRKNESDRPRPRERRAALVTMADAAKALSSAFATLDMGTSLVLEQAAGQEEFHPNSSLFLFNESLVLDGQLRGLERLRLTREAVDALGRWIDVAIFNIPAAKPGPRGADALHWLVQQLAYVYEGHTGRRADSEKKRFEHFAELVVEIASRDADPGIGSGQLQLALRAVYGSLKATHS